MKRVVRLFFAVLGFIYMVILQGCATPLEKMDPLAMGPVNVPMPTVTHTDGAIYALGSDNSLYGSSRAHRVGDLLTVHVDENTDAQDLVTSNTDRTSSNKDSLSVTNTGISGGVESSGENKFTGSGNSHQNNKITGDTTVTVIKVLPNSNLIVKGYKTITLSNGVEKIGISGIVKESDINSTDNSVMSSQIADAHIAYLGHGDLHTSTEKGWLSRVFSSSFWPF